MYLYDVRMDGVMLDEFNGVLLYWYVGGGFVISLLLCVCKLFFEIWLWSNISIG